MKNPRIYTPQTLSVGETVKLEAQASHHLASVLRIKAGHLVTLFNSTGYEFPSEITEISKKQVTLRVNSQTEKDAESPLAIHLAISISKGDRMDFVIQKATELGVTTITPLTTERTNVKLKSDRLEKKQQHWQQVAISACEQCGRNSIPDIKPLKKLEDWLKDNKAEQKFVLHHRSNKKLGDYTKPENIALLIGPEGGLSAEEIQSAEAHGFNNLTLGPRVLRTETAPLAAISILQSHWGDM